ncbi:winged helix DNA-binding domain-containing protein [uncultured Imperialibacter sp.]|uniref:winged helix DNA-binding domain-containing protein n=1 Tax=uncultured Imperialibacter sp. TaxID=1672639 RepID=UPI0030D7447C
MDNSFITMARLANQRITRNRFESATQLVSWMGAMQAQDPYFIKWAVGSRLSGATEQDITKALDEGSILRTHALRPTWHLVAPEDIYWMLELTAQNIKVAAKSRQKELGLTPQILSKSNRLIEQKLEVGQHMTRQDLLAGFEEEGISLKENRSSHLLMWAELEQVICSGVSQRGKHTYALLDQRVPKKVLLSKEESLARLALTYFKSHGPATEADFCWWSGLRAGEARRALEMVRHQLGSEKFDEQVYWFDSDTVEAVEKTKSVFLLPSYDEYYISYKDRTAALPSVHNSKAISNNGIFSPVIAVSGQVKGTWKRAIKKETVFIETKLFEAVSKSTLKLIEVAAQRYAKFLNKKMVISHL